MTDADRAARAERLALMIEADVAVELAITALKRAVPQLEQALGINHDTARSARDLLLDGLRTARKVADTRERTPWP